MNLNASAVFTVLGPLFLVLGLLRCLWTRSWTGSGRTWLLIGIAFCAVAAWLHHSAAGARLP